MNIALRYRQYVRHDDPRVEASNAIALLVAANQPFYPLYVYWMAGAEFWPTLLTLLSTPFFVAVPAVSRANSVAGRLLLPVAGIANTAMSAALLGASTGVLLFLAPCLMIASLQFRGNQRWAGLATAALAGAVYFRLQAGVSAMVVFSEVETARLVNLHVLSVGVLMIFSGFSFSKAGAPP